MKYICLQIDYRDKTISWWDWTEEDEEGTFYSRTGEEVLYTYYKIRNNIFEIHETLLTDIWANKDVLQDVVNHRIIYGEKFIMLLDEKMILKRSAWMNDEYKVYKQNMKEEGELELL